jgi:excinuclease ABC subunit B
LSSREDLAARAAAVLQDAGGNLDVVETLRELEAEMLAAANNLEFEKAALLRDQVRELKRMTGGAPGPGQENDKQSRTHYGRSGGRRRRAPR